MSIAKIRVAARQAGVSVLQTKTVVTVRTISTRINVGVQGLKGTPGLDMEAPDYSLLYQIAKL